jgi:hypothetical protein
MLSSDCSQIGTGSSNSPRSSSSERVRPRSRAICSSFLSASTETKLLVEFRGMPSFVSSSHLRSSCWPRAKRHFLHHLHYSLRRMTTKPNSRVYQQPARPVAKGEHSENAFEQARIDALEPFSQARQSKKYAWQERFVLPRQCLKHWAR